MATTEQVVSVSTAAPVDAVLTVEAAGTGGNYTLTTDLAGYEGTTGTINANASQATFQTEMDGLFGANNTTATRSGSANDYTYSIDFGGGDLAGMSIPEFTAEDNLTGGAGLTIDTDTAGSPRTSPQQLDIDPATGSVHGVCLILRNTGAATVYLGGSTVTSSTGFPLAATTTLAESVELRQDANLYAICADGTNTTVAVLQVDT